MAAAAVLHAERYLMRLRGQVSFPKLVALALRATWELALARVVLHRIKPTEVLRRNTLSALASTSAEAALPAEAAARQGDQVAGIISRMALHVPWRADCLVQALAGQHWLMRYKVPSEIVIGTTKGASGEFAAHAWLLHHGRVILGGDIARYQPLLDSDASQLRSR